MSTDSGTAEKSNETKLPNQTTTGILNIFNIISVCITVFSTIVQYLADKFASFFYGINSELFHSQQFWSPIIDFFIPVLINLTIFLTPFIVAYYYRNSLKTIKEGSDNKEKTLNLLYPPLVILIFCYALLFGCYILYQYAAFFDLINKESDFITICIFLSCVVILLFIEIYIAISKTQQAGKEKTWYYIKGIISIILFLLSNIILGRKLSHIMGINTWLLLILYNFFIAYFLATLLFFIDENKLFFCILVGFYAITFIYTIALPLSSANTYYSVKKQYEIVEPISSSNIASGSNLKVVILHKNNQLLLMDFRISTDENTKDGSAPPQEIEKQAQQNIKEILSKASASNLNIKKGEYTIQDENLYKFYTVTFKKVECE